MNLQVSDFAIVDRIDIEFAPGMTVLTGETGAGKSILVDALGLALGERGSAQLVREGAKRAEFAAGFDVSALPDVAAWLDEQALDLDGECLLRRVINADGRSRAFVNGNAVPLSRLKALGEMLLDIHGQHFHQSLGRKDVQRDLLDHFGGVLDDRAVVAAHFIEWQALSERLQRLRDAEADRASRLDLLRFQLRELESLGLESGEAEALESERQKLRNSGRLAAGVASALDGLFDGEAGNANGLIAGARRSVEALVEYDAALEPALELLHSAGIQVSEAADLLRRYGESVDTDPARRDRVEERLDAIRRISRKHRVDPDELPGLEGTLRAELDELGHAEERSRELEERAAGARSSYLDRAGALSRARAQAAKRLAARVTEAMHGLGMPGGVFDVELVPLGDGAARSWGLDDVRFLIGANPGQTPQPLAKIASGGELSRMGLAIQVIASGGSAIPTMVFDEVDSGVGGGVAEMVGRRLQQLGADRQVLCVTHLAQVASLADRHFRISKVTDGKSTRTRVQALSDEDRIQELARMLGGMEITGKTLEHAAEMLAGARRKLA